MSYRMTSERAGEILTEGNQWSNWSKHCTPEEDAYIRSVWDTMPGYTCWYEALLRIYHKEV